jgi:hypothetical protein
LIGFFCWFSSILMQTRAKRPAKVMRIHAFSKT